MVLAGWKLFFRRAFAHFFAGKGGKFLPKFIVCGACHLCLLYTSDAADD